FEEKAVAKIRDRLNWWQEESAPGSKATLLVQAAVHYNSGDPRCPVCEQEIAELPVEPKLRALKGVANELRAERRVFFRDLTDELNAAVSPTIQALAAKEPAQRLREDWQQLRQGLGAVLAKLVDQYESKVSALL